MRGWKSALFVLIAYGIIEISLLAGLWALDGFGKITYDPIASELSEEQREKLTRFLERGEASSTRFDPVLGWTLDRRGRESNSAQMRDDLEYGPMPPPGKVRITAFGDSFTYGADVSLQESWAKQLVALNSSLQVLNYGVSAYGLDQAYLRYLEVADRDHPQIVFIGYMSENLARHVNVFRPFYSRSYGRTIFSKPRFRLVDGALELLDNPIATRMEHSRLLNSYSQVIDEMGVNDYHYQMGYREGGLDFLPSVRFSKILWSEIKKQALYPILTPSGLYHEESEALEVTVALLDAFIRRS